MALRPVNGRGGMGPHTAKRHHDPHGALTTGLDQPACGLAQDGSVPSQQIGSLLPENQESALSAPHLFAGVEAPREIHRGSTGGRRKFEHDGEAALHVRCADTPQCVPVEVGRSIVVGRNGVEMPSQDKSLGPTVGRPRDDVVTQADRLEPRTCAETFLDQVGQCTFGMAQRRNGHKLRRRAQ